MTNNKCEYKGEITCVPLACLLSFEWAMFARSPWHRPIIFLIPLTDVPLFLLKPSAVLFQNHRLSTWITVSRRWWEDRSAAHFFTILCWTGCLLLIPYLIKCWILLFWRWYTVRGNFSSPVMIYPLSPVSALTQPTRPVRIRWSLHGCDWPIDWSFFSFSLLEKEIKATRSRTSEPKMNPLIFFSNVDLVNGSLDIFITLRIFQGQSIWTCINFDSYKMNLSDGIYWALRRAILRKERRGYSLNLRFFITGRLLFLWQTEF